MLKIWSFSGPVLDIPFTRSWEGPGNLHFVEFHLPSTPDNTEASDPYINFEETVITISEKCNHSLPSAPGVHMGKGEAKGGDESRGKLVMLEK